MKDLWGYDTNRAWKVEAIQKTDAPGISRVIVFVAEQGHSTRPAETSFFVTPDGQHAIAGNQVIAFGTDPFAKTLSILRERAKGPYSGPASSSLMLVEFTDLQDPQCKAAQTSMDRLAQDFPNAHIVYQPYPNVMAHPVAEKAAEYGQCVGKLKGNAAYLQFARAVFDAQANLTAPGADQVLQEAVTKAGADLTAVKECVSGPTTKDVITGSVQLGKDLGVTQPPVLFINGRSVPLNGVPYATLKQIVAFTQTQASTPSATAATSSSAAAKKR
jgi:protein-disulfide isomerase